MPHAANTNTNARASNRRHEVLSPGEVRLLLGACSHGSTSGLRNRALITTLYRGGLRVNEVIRLGVQDLDSRDRIIEVGPEAAVRRVGLDAGAFRIIERWVERRSELALPPTAPLFCTLAGKPLSSSYLRGMLRRLATKAQVDKPVSAEMLRRSLAIELAREGSSLLTIQAQLGHSNPVVTSRYLSRIDADEPRDPLRSREDWVP